MIADPIVREWGTVGGALCQADPSEDLSAAFAALKGAMVITACPVDIGQSQLGTFTPGPYETVVGPAELLTEIRMPIQRLAAAAAYQKVAPPGG